MLHKQRRKLPGYAERAYWNRIVKLADRSIGPILHDRIIRNYRLRGRLLDINYPRRKV